MRWVHIAFLVQLYWTVFGIWIRAAKVNDALWVVPFKVGKPVLTLLVAGSLLLSRHRLIGSRLFATYFALGIWAFVRGAYNEHDTYNIAADAFLLIQGPIWYVAMATTPLDRASLEKLIGYIVYGGLILYGVAILSAYGLLLNRSGFYLGFSCVPLIVSAAYFGYRPRNGWLTLVNGLVIVLSGKRGVLIGAIAALAVSVRRRPDSPLSMQLGKAALLATTIAGLGLLSFHLVRDGTTDDSLFSSSIKKWSLVDPTSEVFDAEGGTGGRIAEIKSAVRDASGTPSNLLLGAGLGFSYTLVMENFYASVEPYHRYVHFSYAWLFVVYGALGLLAMAVVFLSALKTGTELRGGREQRVDFTLVASIIGTLVYACFAASLIVDELTWVLLGLYRNPCVGTPSDSGRD